jgi:hypothetical protein
MACYHWFFPNFRQPKLDFPARTGVQLRGARQQCVNCHRYFQIMVWTVYFRPSHPPRQCSKSPARAAAPPETDVHELWKSRNAFHREIPRARRKRPPVHTVHTGGLVKSFSRRLHFEMRTTASFQSARTAFSCYTQLSLYLTM